MFDVALSLSHSLSVSCGRLHDRAGPLPEALSPFRAALRVFARGFALATALVATLGFSEGNESAQPERPVAALDCDVSRVSRV